MKVKLFIIILSMLIATIFMSGGYALWEKSLIIRGNIEVARPEPLKHTEKQEDMGIIFSEPQAAQITGSTGEAMTE